MRQITVTFARRVFVFVIAISCALAVTNTRGDILFESGTLGPTGIPWSDVESQIVLGANISMFAYNGVKFQLSQPVITTDISGHFVAPSTGTFFGAIVALDDELDFPDSGNLSTPDVIGHSLLNFHTLSAEVFGEISLSLDSGWYALVFGSGLFGATGAGASLLNNPDIGSPQYIGHQPLSGSGWGNLINPIFRNYRFVVQGNLIPEPSTITLLLIALSEVLLLRTRNRQ